MASELGSAVLISPAFHGYEDSVSNELDAHGLDVTCLTYPNADQTFPRRLYYFLLKHTTHRDLETDRQELKLRQLSNTIDAFNDTIRQRVRALDPDFVLVLKGDYLTPATVKDIRDATSVATVLWTYDRIGRLPYTRASLPHYDAVYSYDPADGERYADEAAVQYLPLAHDDAVYDVQDAHEPPIDVSFVGSLRDERRRELLSTVASRLDVDLQVWFQAWNWHNPVSLYRYRIRHRALGNCVHNTLVDHATINEIYNRSKICLNVHKSWKVDRDRPAGLNMRTFEIAGAGGFQLTNDPGNVDVEFDVGEEVVTYEDADDLVEQIRYYLDNPERRERIAARGHERAKREHTFAHRISEIIAAAPESTRGRVDHSSR